MKHWEVIAPFPPQELLLYQELLKTLVCFHRNYLSKKFYLELTNSW